MYKHRAGYQSICVAARFSALPELLALLSPGPDLVQAEANRRVLARASLAVEELFANTIHHGHGMESDNPVWLSVDIDNSVLRVVYSDSAFAFDPFTGVESLNESGVDGRRVGGLGRLLAREMAQQCEYRRDNGCNVILLEYAWPPLTG